MTKITVLDGYTTNPGDLSWDPLARLGDLEVYERTPADEVIDRARNADILLTNKVVIDQSAIDQLPALKCISVLATGYNVIDIKAATRKGIVVCNVAGYASRSAAQHVFALLLALTNRVKDHHQSVMSGKWSEMDDFSYTLSPTVELCGKTIGIYGFGQIGQQVAAIAKGFGMEVIANHKHPERDQEPGIRFVSFEEMMRKADVISLNAPLTQENKGKIDREALALMKPTAFLINTARGGLIVESDLKQALDQGKLAGAGLDVLSEEPPKNGNVLIGARNCIITPHMAWATKEARKRLLDETVKNVKAFLNGQDRNRIN